MLKNLKILFLMLIIIPFCANAKLPQGFVYVSDIDSSIKESMRYYSDQNFIGKVVAGYKTPKAILTLEAATALKLVQQELLKEGYLI